MDHKGQDTRLSPTGITLSAIVATTGGLIHESVVSARGIIKWYVLIISFTSDSYKMNIFRKLLSA